MKVLAPYALLVLGDPTSAVPEPVAGVLVSWNKSSVVVGCLPDVEGDTELVVGRMASIATDDPIVFDGIVDLPSRRFTICTAENQEIYAFPNAADSIHLRVWANHPVMPNRLVVGLLDN